MHKYRADGALGSSWHPYIHEDGEVAPPIQEDETALVLFVFAQFYQMNASPQLLRDFYTSMVVPMANFMASYVNPLTGLPKPSYDLWEEVFLTTTYTTSVVYAALLAAADLADAAKDADSAVKWRAAADDIQVAAHKHLYDNERGAFYKGLRIKDDQIIKDQTLDTSSVFGAFMFGLYPIDSNEVDRAISTLQQRFASPGGIAKFPRYENDNYRRVSPVVPGNWWGITILWLAQYYVDIGKTDEALQSLDWIRSLAGGSGVLPEQINPLTNEFVSVAPLNWTHAEYVATLLDLASEGKDD
jgi:GH15 family glucan-1,4-alpha-glucosidase